MLKFTGDAMAAMAAMLAHPAVVVGTIRHVHNSPDHIARFIARVCAPFDSGVS